MRFERTADGCWALTDDRRDVPGSPFQPGPQRLACHIRSDRFRDFYTGGHHFSRREALHCLVLQERIDVVLAEDPELAELRRAIDARLEQLVRANPAMQDPLADDERRFRRSLLRDLFVLVDDEAMTARNRAQLKKQLEERAADLGAMQPARAELARTWRNASGTIEISAEEGAYRIEGSLADPISLRWTCEYVERFDRDGASFIRHGPGSEHAALRVEGGLLRVEHEGQAPSCGANGSLTGTYFPVG